MKPRMSRLPALFLMPVFLLVLWLSNIPTALADNNGIQITKTATWVDGCRTMRIDITVDDNTVTGQGRPIDVLIMRDLSGSTRASYNGRRVDAWFDDGALQLVDKLFAIPGADLHIAYGTFAGPLSGTRGRIGDAVVHTGFEDAGGRAAIVSAINRHQPVNESTTNFDALFAASYSSFTSGIRADSLKILIVMSDGFPTISIGTHCVASIYKAAGNQYIQAAKAQADALKAMGGKIIYWHMIDHLDTAWEQPRAWEMLNASVSDDLDGNPMAYTCAFDAVQIDTITNAIYSDIRKMRAIRLEDTRTGAGILPIVGSGTGPHGIPVTVSAMGMSVEYESATSSPQTFSYRVMLADSYPGSASFTPSKLTATYYDVRGMPVTRTISISPGSPGVPSWQAAPNPLTVTVPSSSVTGYRGDAITLTATVTGGFTPYQSIIWTRPSDSWTGSGSSVSVSPSVSERYTVTVRDAMNCIRTAFVDVTVRNRPPAVTISSTPNPASFGSPVTVTVIPSDPDGDPQRLTVTWQPMGADRNTPGTIQTIVNNLSRSNGQSYIFGKTSLPAGWYKVTATTTDPSGVRANAIHWIQVLPNGNPVIVITPNQASYQEGEPAAVEILVVDPDDDRMTVTVYQQDMGQLGRDPGENVQVFSGADIPSGSILTHTIEAMIPHPVRLTVRAVDVHGAATEESILLNTVPRPIAGRVLHTDQWEENRQRYNAWARETGLGTERPYSLFFRGERFVLSAETSRYLASEYVSVTIEEHPHLVASLTTTNGYEWSGSVWHEDVFDWEPQTLTFVFANQYIDGTITTDRVTVAIDREEYYRLRRLY